jgi:hypothetical protein
MAEQTVDDALSDDEAQHAFEQVMNGEALLTREQMEGIEREMNGTGSLAVARRLGLAAATQDGTWFRRVASDREMAVSVAGQLEAIEMAAAALREVAGAMEGAAMRTRIAICAHPDMDALMEQARSHAVVQFSQTVTH